MVGMASVSQSMPQGLECSWKGLKALLYLGQNRGLSGWVLRLPIFQRPQANEEYRNSYPP